MCVCVCVREYANVRSFGALLPLACSAWREEKREGERASERDRERERESERACV